MHFVTNALFRLTAYPQMRISAFAVELGLCGGTFVPNMFMSNMCATLDLAQALARPRTEPARDWVLEMALALMLPLPMIWML